MAVNLRHHKNGESKLRLKQCGLEQSIIDRSGGLIDPYEVVRTCVNSLLQKLGEFEASFDSAFERICILASLAGFKVKAFQGDRRGLRGHEAIIMPSAGGT